jgi:hypothetical protein
MVQITEKGTDTMTNPLAKPLDDMIALARQYADPSDHVLAMINAAECARDTAATDEFDARKAALSANADPSDQLICLVMQPSGVRLPIRRRDDGNWEADPDASPQWSHPVTAATVGEAGYPGVYGPKDTFMADYPTLDQVQAMTTFGDLPDSKVRGIIRATTDLERERVAKANPPAAQGFGPDPATVKLLADILSVLPGPPVQCDDGMTRQFVPKHPERIFGYIRKAIDEYREASALAVRQPVPAEVVAALDRVTVYACTSIDEESVVFKSAKLIREWLRSVSA